MKLRKDMKIAPNCQLHFTNNYADFTQISVCWYNGMTLSYAVKYIGLWKHPHLQ